MTHSHPRRPDFLFGLQEQANSNGNIEIRVNGKNIAELSDGLQGEPYGSKGWQAKHSRFSEKQENV